MYYLGFLEKFDPCYENYGEFLINGNRLYCFISYAPNYFEESQYYEVEINYQIFNNYMVRRYNDSDLNFIPFVRKDDSLKYSLTGIFHNDTFCVNNISFKDEELLKLFPHLEGELITLEVDRLDIGLWASKKT
ncbi:hypothetical protein [Neisseria dentiae]|uniref:hypothetical protein n=1 Tax=Neisseria dentiae TaxID=194197 RepID=UPI0035A10D56